MNDNFAAIPAFEKFMHQSIVNHGVRPDNSPMDNNMITYLACNTASPNNPLNMTMRDYINTVGYANDTMLFGESLPRQGLVVVCAPSGIGKTIFMTTLMYHISCGHRRYLGIPIREKRTVVYVALESVRTIKSTYDACCKMGVAAREDIDESNFRFVHNYPFNLGNVDHFIRLVKDANINEPIVVIDTFNDAAMGMDINTPADMNKMISQLRRIGKETGALVVVIHHTGKNVSKGVMGSSLLLNNCDACWLMSRNRDKTIRITLKKMRDGESDCTILDFGVHIESVGTTSYGQFVHGCVAVSPEDGDAHVSEKADEPEDDDDDMENDTDDPADIFAIMRGQKPMSLRKISRTLKETGVRGWTSTTAIKELLERYKDKILISNGRGGHPEYSLKEGEIDIFS